MLIVASQWGFIHWGFSKAYEECPMFTIKNMMSSECKDDMVGLPFIITNLEFPLFDQCWGALSPETAQGVPFLRFA